MKRRKFLKETGVASAVLSAPWIVRGEENAEPIRVGQIGTKHAHASGKMGAMRKAPETWSVVGVVEPDDSRWEAVKNRKEYRDVPRLTEAELLGTPELKAVAVETEVAELVPTARKCVAAGMHVHLDKPAGPSLPMFKALLEESKKQQVVVQMGYMLRYNPAFQLCYKAVREGWLGRPFELHCVMSKTSGAGARKEIAAFSGGSMFELGCHIIDSAVFVLGAPDKVHPHIRSSKAEQGDRLADNMLAVLEYPHATATVRSALIEHDGGRRRQFTVCGDGGTADIRPLEPPVMTLSLKKAQGEFASGFQEVKLEKPKGRYDGEFADLARIIRGEKAPDWTPEHDLAVHETVLRASGMAIT